MRDDCWFPQIRGHTALATNGTKHYAKANVIWSVVGWHVRNDSHPCNYKPMNPLNTCYKCALRAPHPWHDDGTDGPEQGDWFKGGEYGMPDFHNEENGFGA